MVGKLYKMSNHYKALNNLQKIGRKYLRYQNIYFFKVTYGVDWSHPDVYGILMFNSECRMKDHPFDSICDKRWIVNTFGNFEEYSNDPSITLICKY